MPDDAYDPASIRVLAGLEPPKRPAGFIEDRHAIEDGPGSGTRVELTVRVLVGTERSTVIVADPLTGRALTHEVLPHGREADVAAAAIEAAVHQRLDIEEVIAMVRRAPDVPPDPGDEWPPLSGEPGGGPGGVPEPPGEPRE